MSSPSAITRYVHRHAWLQLGLVMALWLAGEVLVKVLSLPLPAGIIGLALLLWLLATRRLSLASVRSGAQWLLADMLLFFVPAALAVLDHHELLGLLGLKVLFVILVSTLSVMLVTALAVDRYYRWRLRRVGLAANPC